MFLFDTELKDSQIAGKGVFAREPIPRGAIAGFLNYKTNIITEEQYQQAQREGNQLLIQSAVRWIGDYFLHHTENKKEDYINHTENANLLYHCGVLFATSDIKAGEELTVNYKYFLAVDDVYAFPDIKTRKTVSGLPGKEALLQSCRELMKLYSDAEIDAPHHSDFEELELPAPGTAAANPPPFAASAHRISCGNQSVLVQPEASSHPICGTRSSELATEKLY